MGLVNCQRFDPVTFGFRVPLAVSVWGKNFIAREFHGIVLHKQGANAQLCFPMYFVAVVFISSFFSCFLCHYWLMFNLQDRVFILS